MATRIQDSQATVQRTPNATNRPWIQGERKSLGIRLRDSSGDPIDLTGWTVACRVRWFTTDVEEEYDPDAAPPAQKLTASLSNYARDTTRDDSTLTVTIDTPATAGEATYTIPADFYTETIPPNLTADVPTAVLYFAFTPPAAGDIQKIRHSIYIRDGGPSD